MIAARLIAITQGRDIRVLYGMQDGA